MTTYRFAETKVPATKNLPCPDCGKKVRRSTTFSQTTNPFTNPPNKTPDEIRADLAPQVKEWQETPVRCGRCEDAAYLRAVDAAKAEAAAWNEKHPNVVAVRFKVHDREREGFTYGAAHAVTGHTPRAVIGVDSDVSRFGAVSLADITWTREQVTS